ncbi:MAG: SOS response-associated peptidase [Pseudomonadota bacterium]
MCGRYLLTLPPEVMRQIFRYREMPNFPQRYNVAPTQPIPVVIALPGGERSFRLMRWGLLPSWVKDPKGFPLLINARSEQAATKPAFRAAMRRRRCLIPADGFYEWQRAPNGKKQPFFVRRADEGPMTFAGIWETYSDPEGGEIDTAAILTTDANATLAPIHDRMPVILDDADYDRWLDVDHTTPDDLRDLMRPAEDNAVIAYPVSTRVNRVANDDPGLLEPLAETTTPAGLTEPGKPKRAKPKPDQDQLKLF